MFYLISTILFFALFFISAPEWIRYRRQSPQFYKKFLKKASHLVFLAEWKRAELTLTELKKHPSTSEEAWQLLALVLRKTRQFENLKNHLKRADEKFPLALWIPYERALFYLEAREYAKSFELFSECLPLLKSEEDFFCYAKTLFHLGHYSETLNALAPFSPNSTNPHLWLLIGDAAFYLDQLTLSEKAYFTVEKLKGPNQALLVRRGYLAKKQGDGGRAEKFFGQVLQIDSEDLLATLGYGSCLENRGLYLKALYFYQNSPCWSGADHRLIRQAGYSALHAKKFDIAEKYFKNLFENGFKDSTTYLYLGYSLECQQKWGECETLYLQMVEEHPSHYSGYLALAWLFGVGLSRMINSAQGTYFAEKAFELYTESALPSPVLWEIVSACRARIGEYEQAYQIQENLYRDDKEASERSKRQEIMRTLRKNLPLTDLHIQRPLVA